MLAPPDGRLVRVGGDTARRRPVHRFDEQIELLGTHDVADDPAAVGDDRARRLVGVRPSLSEERITAAMDTVGIVHRRRHYPHQLSGGQQQRAAIARAIVGEPKLILADEPTGNLDSQNGEQVMNILSALNDAGSTILMVTHSPSHADMAKRRIDMLDGRIVASAMRAL